MDNSSLSSLPAHLHDDVLLQAWQLLNQRHFFGVIPLVSRAWLRLAAKNFTKVHIYFRSAESAEQFTAWLLRHGHTLQHAKIRLSSLDYKHRAVVDGLVAALCTSCLQLRSLSLSNLEPHAGSLVHLSKLTQLTSLRLHKCLIPPLYSLSDDISTAVDSSTRAILSICSLSQLRSLDLAQNHIPWLPPTPSLRNLTENLPHLSSLDLSGSQIDVKDMAALVSLKDLQELRLGGCYLPVSSLQTLSNLPCTSVGIVLDPADVPQFSTWMSSAASSSSLMKLDVLLRDPSVYQPWDLVEDRNLADLLLQPMVACKTLQHLDVSGWVRYELQQLTELTQLTQLCVPDSMGASAEDCRHLSNLTNLQKLKLCMDSSRFSVLATESAYRKEVKEVLSSCLPQLRKLTVE